MPLQFPREPAVWDAAHSVIRFTARDADSNATVDCSITARAMIRCCGAVATSPSDLLDTFGRFRLTIQFAANLKYDKAPSAHAVRLLSRDLDAAGRLPQSGSASAPRRPEAPKRPS